VNATQYEFDVDVSAPVGTVLFTMTNSTRNASFLGGNIDLSGENSTFSVNGAHCVIIDDFKYDKWGLHRIFRPS